MKKIAFYFYRVIIFWLMVLDVSWSVFDTYQAGAAFWLILLLLSGLIVVQILEWRL